MPKHTVTFSGENIVDKRTHYEVSPYLGSDQVTLVIRSDIFADFYKKYKKPMTSYKELQVHKVDFIQNRNHVDGNPFCSPKHLRGAISSIDDIIIKKE